MRFIPSRGLVMIPATLGAVVLILAACKGGTSATPTPSPAPTATPRPIPSPTATPTLTATSGQGLPPGVSPRLALLVQQQAFARAVGNVAAVMDTFTDDATYAGLGLCAPTPCMGKAAIQKQVEREVVDRLAPAPAPGATPQIAGNAISARFDLRSDSMRAMGADRIVGTLTFEFKGDKISAIRFAPDATDSQTLAYLARSVSTPAPAPTFTPTPPGPNQRLALLVQQQAFARAVANVPAVMDTFAEDATYAGLGLCAPTPCVGKAAIQREVEGEVADKLQATPAPGAVPQVSGNTLSARFELRSDSIRATGVERIVGNLSFDVKGDKISAMRFEPDANDAQTAGYLARQQG